MIDDFSSSPILQVEFSGVFRNRNLDPLIFRYLNNIKKHHHSKKNMSSKHNDDDYDDDEDMHACTQCDSSFSTEDDLNAHTTTSHPLGKRVRAQRKTYQPTTIPPPRGGRAYVPKRKRTTASGWHFSV